MNKIGILLYDDNDALRQSLEQLLLQNELYNVYALSDANSVEEDIKQFLPQVVLMDIDMLGTNGVEAVERIRKTNTHLPIIMLTIFEDNEYIFKSICAGASGYILKRFAAKELNNAIENVLTGGAPMTGIIAKKVLAMLPIEKNTNLQKVELNEKEKSILQSLVDGNSYKMIATSLDVTIDTVRFHIKKIYEKLHVHSAVEAVTKAINEKLV